jgi:hypothetical protein
MPAKPLDRLMFFQGEPCFFCKQPLPWAEASVEPLLATANGGNNMEEKYMQLEISLRQAESEIKRLEGRLKGAQQRAARKIKAALKCQDEMTVVTTDALSHALFNITSDSDKYAWVAIHVKKLHPCMRPRTLKAFNNMMATNFPDLISEAERMAILHQLKSAGQIIVEGKKIHYVL